MMEPHRNSLVLLLAVSMLALVLGFAYGATFTGGCSDIKEAPFGCVEYMVSRYQTLIAMFGAVFVGVYAVRPVLRQLGLTSLQTTVTLHQTYSAREKLLESRAKTQMAELDKLSIDLNQGYSQREDDGGSLSHWVWDMQQEVDRMRYRLSQWQTENLDGDETTIARQNLITALRRLDHCMIDFNGTVYVDDPELGVTDEEKAKVYAAEQRAIKDLPARISEASAAVGNVREAFDTDLGEIRLKRQLLDQVLVNAELP
jgi:hypothetical protein